MNPKSCVRTKKGITCGKPLPKHLQKCPYCDSKKHTKRREDFGEGFVTVYTCKDCDGESISIAT